MCCVASTIGVHAWVVLVILAKVVPPTTPIHIHHSHRPPSLVAAQGEDVDATAQGAEDAADLTALQENLDNKGQNAYYCETYRNGSDS